MGGGPVGLGLGGTPIFRWMIVQWDRFHWLQPTALAFGRARPLRTCSGVLFSFHRCLGFCNVGACTGTVTEADPHGPRNDPDPRARLELLLDRLGPDWDETRVRYAPTDEATVQRVSEWLMDVDEEPETKKPARLRPTGGWFAFLLPMVGVGAMIFGMLLVGANMADPMTGSLLIAGGFLLIILAALGRGKRVEETRRRKEVEEVLLYYDLEPDATRAAFLQQVALAREAQGLLQDS